MSAPQGSARDRRHDFRFSAVLPISVRLEIESKKDAFTEQSVNLSGGGIGFISARGYNPGDILVVTLSLSKQVTITSRAEVLRLTALPHPHKTHRIHARFIGMPEQVREQLIRHVLHLQREHLNEHYSA